MQRIIISCCLLAIVLMEGCSQHQANTIINGIGWQASHGLKKPVPYWYDHSVARADNSYVTYYDTASTVKPTPKEIRKLCRQQYGEDPVGRNQIFEIRFGDNYVYAIRHADIGFELYDFYAYAPDGKCLTMSPVTLNGTWSADNESGFDNHLLEGLLVETHDGKMFLRERMHNGNSYNAVVLYCYSCNEECEWALDNCIEEVSLCHTPDMDPDGYFIIRRKRHEDGRVECIKEEADGTRKPIGQYVLSDKGEMGKVEVTDSTYGNWVVTTSGAKAAVFSKTGSR